MTSILSGIAWRELLIGASLVMLTLVPLAFVLGRRSVTQDDFPDADPYGDSPEKVPHG